MIEPGSQLGVHRLRGCRPRQRKKQLLTPFRLQILGFVLGDDISPEKALAQARIDVAGDGTVSHDHPEDIKDTLATTFNATPTPTRATAYPNRFATPLSTRQDLVENDHYATTEIIHPWADAVAVE